MASHTVEIAPGIHQIVLNFSEHTSEIAQLRTCIEALESQRSAVQAPAEVDGSNSNHSVEQREPIPNVIAGVTPICSGLVKPGRYMQSLKPAFKRTVVTVLKDETIWEDFPEVGFSIKPSLIRTKKGNWLGCERQKLLRPQNELIACWDGQWCYLGTYATSPPEMLSAEEFAALPDMTRKTVIAQSGNKRYHRELRAMYATGELVARKIRFRRVGYNVKYGQALVAIANQEEVDAGLVHTGSGMTSAVADDSDDAPMSD
ncbi:hypothetical protein POSPLADRAFT_1048072 [Postia placenta MAD-698-R-SB12]|uniref:DUF6697 domain-containing protein n=1 Tax=Postia placenta MAD-698-R-SB12 TaxID=670580 RepID=A0A1X6MWS0_9APHY|nr:hypothetical protein POSPLADRAFT_1048072 [Postia placenta MAD-698-R-SB12]OSX60690.1 hypothetical protein POSPLADRAFT_1048072 [Postia placenta MAD-698-R-SB12]